MRPLSPDEARLWAQVAATIRPLSREKPSSPEPLGAEAVPPARPKPPLKRVEPRIARAPSIANNLDGSWDKRLRSGAVQPDRMLDLHGMNLEGAWQAIDHALEQAISAGDRILLVVTGHHRPGTPPVERGKIRAAVHDWLAASRHAPQIAAVRGAHRRHGGGGSLYIVLRRR